MVLGKVLRENVETLAKERVGNEIYFCYVNSM